MSAYSIPTAHEPWMNEAPCTTVDPELFFPAREEGNIERTMMALSVCASCPSRLKCLTYAIENGEQGIWGGTTEQERASMMRAAS